MAFYSDKNIQKEVAETLCTVFAKEAGDIEQLQSFDELRDLVDVLSDSKEIFSLLLGKAYDFIGAEEAKPQTLRSQFEETMEPMYAINQQVKNSIRKQYFGYGKEKNAVAISDAGKTLFRYRTLQQWEGFIGAWKKLLVEHRREKQPEAVDALNRALYIVHKLIDEMEEKKGRPFFNNTDLVESKDFDFV